MRHIFYFHYNFKFLFGFIPQILSMRNGLSLHPMYLPENLQLMQQPSQMGMGFAVNGARSEANMSVADMLQQHCSHTLNQSELCYQPPIAPNATNINNLTCTFHESFQLPIAEEVNIFHPFIFFSGRLHFILVKSVS